MAFFNTNRGPQGATGESGDTGATGTSVLTGATDPAGGTGNNGDVYIQTDTGDTGVAGSLWKKTAGAWAIILTLVIAE